MSDHLNALPQGFMLQEYRILRVLGSGGFGITYLALDTNLDKEVAVKEYLPNELAVRQGETTVRAKSTADEDDYNWGLDRFVDEAKTLARFMHPNIVPVLRFFEAHGTAYTIMEYEAGPDLSVVLKSLGDEKPSEQELQALLMPLLEGLEVVHQAGYLHRDIKPGNIIIRDDDVPVLIDFGAARQAMGAKSNSITSIVTPGYAPIEQYSIDGDQGAWSDIYAMGAIIYQAMTGKAPADSPTRVKRDPYVPLVETVKGIYSESFLEAIDWALKFDLEDRPKSIAEWKKALSGGEISASQAPSSELSAPAISGAIPPAAKKSSGSGKKIAAVLVLLAVLGGSGWYLYDLDQKHKADVAAWEIATRTHTIPAYQKYRGQFPKGEKFDQAKSAISFIEIKIAKEKAEKLAALKKADIDAWESSKRIHTIKSYQKYLTKFANGINGAAARKAITELRKKEEERLARLEREAAAKKKAARLKLAEEAYRKGVRLKNSRSYTAAIREFKKSLKLDPTKSKAHNQIGNVHFSKGQYVSAIRKYNDALRLSPNDKIYLVNLGSSYRNLKQYERSVKQFNKALRSDPNYVIAFVRRGITYDRMNSNSKALKDFASAIRINPNYAYAFFRRAMLYNKLKQYDRAIQDFDAAIRKDSKYMSSHFNRGVAYYGKRQYQNAIRDFKEAARLDPKTSSTYHWLGLIYSKMGQNSAATRNYKKSYDLGNRSGNVVRHLRAKGLIR